LLYTNVSYSKLIARQHSSESNSIEGHKIRLVPKTSPLGSGKRTWWILQKVSHPV